MQRIIIAAACGALLLVGCADQKSGGLDNVRGTEGVVPGTNYLDHNHDGQADTMTIGISQTEAELHILYGTNWVKVYCGPGVRMPRDSEGNPWTRPFKDVTATEYTFLKGQWIECPTGHEMDEWEPERTNH